MGGEWGTLEGSSKTILNHMANIFFKQNFLENMKIQTLKENNEHRWNLIQYKNKWKRGFCKGNKEQSSVSNLRSVYKSLKVSN